jgi:hypothetical protein
MADPIDMLELARKLIPDIETGMPEDVAKAFAEGKIKSIFRTADSPGLASFGKTGDTGSIGGRIDAGSTYFLNEDGGIARYGRHGAGWGDARLSSEGTGVARSSFLDEAIFTKESINHSTATAKSIDEGIASGVYSNKPGIGLGLVEFDRNAAGELMPDKMHSGHWVSDIYHSSGEAEFTSHLNTGKAAPRNSNLDVVKTNISDINFETQANSYGRTEGIPRLKTPSSGVPPTTPPPPAASARSASDGFIQVGESAKGQIDESMLNKLNASLSEIGLDSRTFSFTSQNGSGAIKDLGSTTGITKNMVGAVTTQGVANATLHPQAVHGDLAASAFDLKNNGITPTGFLDFAQAENIKIGGHIDFDNMSAFVMDKGLLDPQALKSIGGLDTEIAQNARALKTTLHEVGHVVGRQSGANVEKDAALKKIQGLANKVSSGSGDLSNISLEYNSSLMEHVRQKALDEARAETFSHHTASQSKIGQDFLEHLKTVDFSTNILNDNGKLSRRYGQTFLDTGYYHFNQGSETGFENYSSAGKDFEDKLRNLGVNVEDARLRAEIHSTGTLHGAVDFGEYSETYNPIRQRLSDINRQHILDTYGQEYADIYDEGIKFGEQNRYSVQMSDLPSAATVAEDNATRSVPLADEYDTGTTAERVAAGETLDEPPPVRSTRKRPTIGTKVDDATTAPSPDGPRVGRTPPPSGVSDIEDLVDLTDDQKRNMANLTNTPTAPNTNAAAKITSNIDDVDMTARQAITQIGDQINNLRRTKKILSNDGARGVAEAVTKGIKGSKNLRLAALGTAVGIGGYAASRMQHRNDNSDLMV